MQHDDSATTTDRGPADPPVVAVLPARPPHLDPRMVAVVLVGGIAGATARYLVKVVTPGDPWPWGTWSVNLVGAFLLGLLVAWLAARGPDTGRRRTLRLLLGTGFMGAFTTYSSLAVETERLLADERWGVAAGYAGSTLVLGLLLSLAGLALGTRIGSGRGPVVLAEADAEVGA